MTEGGRRVSVREGDVDTAAQMAKGMMSGRVQEPRNAGGFQKLVRQGTRFSLGASRRNAALLTP